MLRVAPDASTKERVLDELYPGREIKPVAWDSCLHCKQDVDVYVYRAGKAYGYCYEHYPNAQ